MDTDLLKNTSDGENDEFYAQADALIKHKGQEWLNKLPDVGGATRYPTVFSDLFRSVSLDFYIMSD